VPRWQPAEQRSRGDAERVRRCLAGRPEAWEELLQRYQRLIYSIPRRMGLSADDCADVFQSVCTILLEKLSSLRQHARLSSWIVTTTKREALRVRQLGRRESSWSRVDPETGQERELEPAVDPVVEHELLQLEREQRLLQGWERLEQRCQALLRALFLAPELDYDAISRQFDLPIGSIGPTRMRCLRKLRGILGDLGL
jgi:RNA polymerase sigma factor (sigma-70 family)